MEFTSDVDSVRRPADRTPGVEGNAAVGRRGWSRRRLAIAAACLCFLATAAGAKDKPPLVLPAGSKVGIVNLLGADLTYYYIGTTIFQNRLKTFPVDWNIPQYFDSLLQKGLADRGFVPVVIEPSAFLRSHRTDLYASSGWFTTDEVDRVVPDEIEAWKREHGIAAVIVVSTEADKTFKIGSGFWSARYATFPDQLVDWGVIVKNPLIGKPIPYIYNASAPILVDLSEGEAETYHIERGSKELIEWKEAVMPDDASQLTSTELAAARPLLEQAIGRQIERLVQVLSPAAVPVAPTSEAPPAQPAATEAPSAAAPATGAPEPEPPADAPPPPESPPPADRP